MQAVDSLAFVVNPRSGGRLGSTLYRRLQDLVPSDRLIDVRKIRGDRWLKTMLKQWAAAADGSARIIACGGDGTASRLADQARLAARSLNLAQPAIGVLPLGTGNDLGLALGWKPERVRPDSIAELFGELSTAPLADVDRWKVRGPNGLRFSCFNYVSWGMDARVARFFDQLRGRHPKWFSSRFGNKAAYAALALTDSSRSVPIQLSERPIPTWAKSLVFANIHSYAGGGHLPGVTAGDGLLDAFCLGGGFLMGFGTRGVRRPYGLGARRRWNVHVQRPVAMQADGEPSLARPGNYVVKLGSSVPMLLGPDGVDRTVTGRFQVLAEHAPQKSRAAKTRH